MRYSRAMDLGKSHKPTAEERVDQELPMICSIGGEICTTLKPAGPR